MAPSKPEAVRRQYLQNIIEGINDGVIVVDRDGLVRFHNHVAAEAYGIAERQVLPSAFELSATEAGPKQVEVLKADGRELTVELRAAPIEWNGRGCRLVSIRDVTARKESEQRFRLSQERMREAIDRQNGDLIDAYDKLRHLVLDRQQWCGKIVFDEACRITYVNRKLCEMLGYEAEDLLAIKLTDVVDQAGARLIVDFVDRLTELERPTLSVQMRLRGVRREHSGVADRDTAAARRWPADVRPGTGRGPNRANPMGRGAQGTTAVGGDRLDCRRHCA